MKRWSQVLKRICQIAESKKLYVIEGDQDLNWYGMPLEDLCTNVDLSDTDLYKVMKSKAQEEVEGSGYIALVSPVNLYVDIFPSSSRRFASSFNKGRPFDITRDHFRIGFFNTKEEAVNFFLEVSRKLKEDGLNLHLFYG